MSNPAPFWRGAQLGIVQGNVVAAPLVAAAFLRLGHLYLAALYATCFVVAFLRWATWGFPLRPR